MEELRQKANDSGELFNEDEYRMEVNREGRVVSSEKTEDGI